MIDFTKSIELYCNYGGSEKKKKIFYNGSKYLLKFPDPVREKNSSLSYVNNTFSEFIGCKIFELLGISVQEVILGKYEEKSGLTKKEKIVVACKDFTSDNKTLLEFSSLANSITSTDKHLTTNIEDIYTVIDSLNFEIDRKEFINSFWNMFVVDTLIGNTDRHLSNFGLVLENEVLKFAPVYDCGSALHPLLSDEEMSEGLNDVNLFKDETYNIHPVYKYKNKRLTYKEFYNENLPDLSDSVLRIVPLIDLDSIYNLIDSVECMSDVRKEYLKESIKIRKEMILDIAYKNIVK